MIKISVLWMRSGTWNRSPIKLFASLIRLLATFVGNRNLNRPKYMWKFKSSQKDKRKKQTVGRFLVSSYIKIESFQWLMLEGLFFRANAGCLMCIANL